MNNFLNNIKYINFKSKKTIFTIIAILLILIIGITLYNIRFKYDSQDPFFKAINVRARQLDNEYVHKKQRIIRKAFLFATRPSSSESIKLIKTVQNKNLSNKYIADNIIQNPFPFQIFEYQSNKYYAKLAQALGWVKVSDRRTFAKYYTDLKNQDFQIPMENSYTYIKLPYNASLAFNIKDPSCMTRTGAGRFYCGDAYLDINGTRPPNQLGVDLFDLGIYFKPRGYLVLGELYNRELSNILCFSGNGKSCFHYVKNNNRTFLLKNVQTSNYSFKHFKLKRLYLASNGKLVYFDENGFYSFFKFDIFKSQMPIALDNAYWNNPVRKFNEFVKTYKEVRIIQKQIEQEEDKKPKSFIYPNSDTKPVVEPPQNKDIQNSVAS